MKKISCCGYHATGSGAVDDFLREFNNIETAQYGVECRFLQDPDGISDLEYNLIDNPHRLNSGYALKRFLSFAKAEERTYRHIFQDKWLPWAQDYINSLSDFSYNGYWHADIRDVKGMRLFIYKARRAVNKILPKIIRKNKYYCYFPKIETYVANLDRETFLKKTRDACDRLCEILNKSNKEYVVLDQVASPQNVSRYVRYIRDLKVIVVDRDPRDVYLNDVVINKNYVLPKDIHQFCEVYRMSRKQIQREESECVLRIYFEDMIYRYDETTMRVMDFLGLKSEQHINPKQYFNPIVSIKNTRIWERNQEYTEIAEKIANELPEFLVK